MQAPEYASSAPQTSHTATLIVQHYEHLLNLSSQMLESASAGHWDETAELVEHYSQAVEALEDFGLPTLADAPTCRTLIGRILQNDARLRELVEPERNRLNLEMGNLKRQTAVLHTYSSPILTHER